VIVTKLHASARPASTLLWPMLHHCVDREESGCNMGKKVSGSM
jgi:hypothetical protein